MDVSGISGDEARTRNGRGCGLATDLRAFMAARELWVIEKGYEPREKLKTEIEKAEMVLTA